MVYLGGTVSAASCSFYLMLIADMLAVDLEWSSILFAVEEISGFVP